MATMKDVAKLAGVSHGTVSNVINGGKQVSIDKIKRVEAAMEQLGYRPNTAARNLKMEYTQQIDLVVPNMITGEFLELYEAVRRCALLDGYTVNLKVTDGIADHECAMLNESLMNNVDGVLLVTCQPDNHSFFETLQDQGLHMVFCVSDRKDHRCNYVGMDVTKAVYDIVRELASAGKRVALIAGDAEDSYHDQLVQSYCNALTSGAQVHEDVYLEILRVSPEFAAKGAARIYSLEKRPDAILVSNEMIAKEIHRMERMLYCAETPEVIVFRQGAEYMDDKDRVIQMPFAKLGKMAYQILFDEIHSDRKTDNVRELIPVTAPEQKADAVSEWNGKRSLRVLLNESPSSDAVRYLAANFEKTTGIRVVIDTLDISRMYHAVKADAQEQHYDIYSVDVPWMEELVGNGYIQRIDQFAEKHRDIMEAFGPTVLERYSNYRGHTYGVPYSFASQILFYRKDLFEKAKNQRLYYEWYKEELKVPTTWEEYNKVARFFTRAFNPESETEYGTTLGAKDSSGACCEYLLRLWGNGAGFFDTYGRLRDKEPMIHALKQYQEAFAYADPKAVDWWWDEQVKAFMQEKAAMMVMFTEHAAAISEKNHSSIAGKYQVATLPGNISVLGGWSLVVRKGTTMMQEAERFLEWIMSPELLEISAILGRVYPMTDEISVEKMEQIYRWFPQAVTSFEGALPRCVPEAIRERAIMEMDLERVLGHFVHDAVKEHRNPEEAITEAVQYARETLIRLL